MTVSVAPKRDGRSNAPRLGMTMSGAILATSLCAACYLMPEAAANTHGPGIGARLCQISGWSETAEAGGRRIAVRATPSNRGRVSGRLPTVDSSYSGRKPQHLAEFDIVETRNGWFRISNVRIIAIQELSYDAYPSKITGWIEPSAIRFNIQSSQGFAKPDRSSAELVHSPDWVMDAWQILSNCDGKWVEVEALPGEWDEDRPDYKLPNKKAWFRGICGRSMNGCGDVVGD